jgi:ribosomal protein L9
MLDEKVIMARLKKGESIDAIANECAEMLNKANKEYTEAKKAEAEAEKIQKQKVSELQTILDECSAWCTRYYGTSDALSDELFGLGSAEDLVRELDGLHNFVNKANVKVLDADEAIKEFLNLMKW